MKEIDITELPVDVDAAWRRHFENQLQKYILRYSEGIFTAHECANAIVCSLANSPDIYHALIPIFWVEIPEIVKKLIINRLHETSNNEYLHGTVYIGPGYQGTPEEVLTQKLKETENLRVWARLILEHIEPQNSEGF